MMKLLLASFGGFLIGLAVISGCAKVPIDDRITKLPFDGTYTEISDGTYIIKLETVEITLCIVLDKEGNETCYSMSELRKARP